MTTSLQTELLNLIRENYPQEVSIDKLYMLCEMLSHKQSTGERKLRVLTHSGLIEPIKTDKGAIKAYKAVRDIVSDLPDEYGIIPSLRNPKREVINSPTTKVVEQNRLNITLPRILA